MLNLSERQQATIGTAVTVVATLVILCTIGALIWLLAIFLGRFSNVFMPLAVAAIVSLVLRPYYLWLLGNRFWRLKLPPVAALGVVLLSILLPIAGFLWFFGDLLVDQITGLVENIRGPWWTKAMAWLEARMPQLTQLWHDYDVEARLNEAVQEHASELLSGIQFLGLKALTAGAGVFSAIGALFNWTLVPVYVAFILLGGRSMKGAKWAGIILPFFKAETRDDIIYLVEEFVEIIVAFFRGQLLIAFLQGLLYGIGFQIVGLNYGFVLGLGLGFLNIIPYLGMIVGGVVTLPMSFFQEDGGLWLMVAVLVVIALVQMVEGYLLTPRIMGNQTGLHPMAIMVAMFFWGSALNGILGMLLAIPLTAFFVVFWRLAREKYIRELV